MNLKYQKIASASQKLSEAAAKLTAMLLDKEAEIPYHHYRLKDAITTISQALADLGFPYGIGHPENPAYQYLMSAEGMREHLDSLGSE